MKKVFLVAFELHHPDSLKNREAIEGAIKGVTGWWWHHIGDVWLVAGDDTLTANGIYEKVGPHLRLKDAKPDDSVFIVSVNPIDRRGWLPKSAWDWMRKVSGQAPVT